MSGKKSSVLVLAALTVIIAGTAGAVVYFQSRLVKLTARESMSRLPAETIAAAYISGETNDWSQLQQFGTAAGRETIGQWLKQLESQAIGDAQISVAQDILPWVGNLTVAMLPPASDLSSQPPETTPVPLTEESNVVMLVGIKNKLRAWNFARKFESRPGVKTEKIPYNGVTISKTGTDQSNATYSVVLDDYLAVAADRRSLEKVIDTVASGVALDDGETAAKLLAQSEPISNSLAHLYIFNPAATTAALQEFSGEANPVRVQYFENAVVSVGLDEVGLRVKSTIAIPNGSLPPAPNPQNLAPRFPSDTVALMVGTGISQFWANVVAASAQDANVASQVQMLRSLFKSYGNFDVDKDIFGWMDGDYAVGAILPQPGSLSQPGVLMLLESSRQDAALAAVKKLEAFARSALPVEMKAQESVVSIGEYEQLPITQWTIAGQGMILGGYGWLDKEKMLFAFSGQPPSLSLFSSLGSRSAALPEKSGNMADLTTSPNFQSTVNSLPSPNQGYFYLDMARIFAQISPMLKSGNPISPIGLALSESVSAIGATTIIPDPETVQLEAIIALQRQN
ncbi:MAG TPA: DUF3352 domain-containing protein [Oscillatoriaceae cyanobacterium M33_DOE_052]|uniref:DUF3352 domain-containing protein n=1 Tax=Planktothricoides sp. SpSt-374 TaxID=2282167 RepID=A0A7C3ZMJ4_9CYAN|nr:DUF3352 domain-containing protein [Oscillatoriaceae cyanobacterium M33_DOE_052]